MFIVYKALHRPTGKVYVGQTGSTLISRIEQHWAERRPHKLTKFIKFLLQSKMSDWEWSIIEVIRNQKEARECELHYVKLWNLYDEGLNSRTGSNIEANKKASERMKIMKAKNPIPWNKGLIGVSNETSILMSIAKIKNPTRNVYTQEDKDRISLDSKNRKEVMELKSGLRFPSISRAAKHFNLKREAVRDVVNGRRKHTAGYVFAEVDQTETAADNILNLKKSNI